MDESGYRLCDVCNTKCFYDATLLYNLGDWACICKDCATDYVCVVIKKTDIEKEDEIK